MKSSRFVLSILLLTGAVHADITPHPLFCDHAVLQRDTEVPVWGFSNKEGEKVSVSIDNKPAVVTTAKNGKWMVKLPANPTGGPHTLTIAGDNKVVLNDILFGEVWICSGQSNMEMNFSTNAHALSIADKERVPKDSALPGLRFFNVKNATSPTPLDKVVGNWQPATPESAKAFSFVGQCFGRDLKKALGDNIPVGLIEADWGGKQFKPATATIEGGKLVVSSPEVTEPTAVRYGWSNVPNPALWNKDGLPASPFRSDVE